MIVGLAALRRLTDAGVHTHSVRTHPRRRAVPLIHCEGLPLTVIVHRHRMKQGYPLNLSISLSGGEETNQDAPSNGE